MNKSELINAVAEKTGFTKKDTEAVVSSVFGTITEAMSSGDKVQLVGFGSFEVKERKEKIGRNPKTKEEIKIAAKKSPSFKAGKSLKDIINK
jgi:DNA-binding protein HU-beta